MMTMSLECCSGAGAVPLMIEGGGSRFASRQTLENPPGFIFWIYRIINAAEGVGEVIQNFITPDFVAFHRN